MKTQKPKKKEKTPDALPIKPVLDELTFVRKSFRDLAAQYTAQIEGELALVRESVATVATRKKIPASCARGMSDLLLLLRGLEIKPGKGRRRDFKKIETLVDELRHIVDGWE